MHCIELYCSQFMTLNYSALLFTLIQLFSSVKKFYKFFFLKVYCVLINVIEQTYTIFNSFFKTLLTHCIKLHCSQFMTLNCCALLLTLILSFGALPIAIFMPLFILPAQHFFIPNWLFILAICFFLPAFFLIAKLVMILLAAQKKNKVYPLFHHDFWYVFRVGDKKALHPNGIAWQWVMEIANWIWKNITFLCPPNSFKSVTFGFMVINGVYEILTPFLFFSSRFAYQRITWKLWKML